MCVVDYDFNVDSNDGILECVRSFQTIGILADADSAFWSDYNDIFNFQQDNRSHKNSEGLFCLLVSSIKIKTRADH